MKTVSIVIPIYNEAETLERLYQRTRAALQGCDLEGFELVFVDDGSTDGTGGLIEQLAAIDPAVKLITLSRNFGHHPAVFAGLANACGEAIVILDADLQDPPELIPKLLETHWNGYELVFARRTDSQDRVIMKTLKRAFRSLMRSISAIDFPHHVGVYSVMSRTLKQMLLSMPERERYLVAMQLYLGFRVGFVDYVREQRQGGVSKQGWGRLFRLGMNSLFAYSSLPLRCSMVAGFLCLLATVAALAYILYSKFVLRNAISGWASVMVAILGMGTIQLLSLWVIGEYVDRIFENTKGRPYFIVWKQTGQPGIPTVREPARMR